MPTGDFIEDAIDSLKGDSECSYILIASHFGSVHGWKSANVPSRQHLAWMKRRFAELCAELESQYDADKSSP